MPPPFGGSGSGSGSGSPACSCVDAIASSSCWGSSPGSSNGSRLRRCGSASSAATRMSDSSTVCDPRHAACATAVRATTRSARIPSTSNAAHSAAMRRNSLSGNSTSPTDLRAAVMRRASSASCSAYAAAKPAWSASNASRARMTSARTSTSRDARTSTVSPNRSSSCGRSSPSSGFMVPIRTKRASWLCDTPSRSMCTRPIAAASSSTSTRWSCSRLTSSTYSTPPCARASRPGENACSPSRSTRCRSSDPTTRSSVAPIGNSTSAESASTAESTWARPRTAVDFAVPFSPRISTPPISGRTAQSTSASRSLS